MNGTQVTPGGGGARADISDRATAAIRPVDPAQQAALSDFFAALSVETRYRRFFAPVRPSHGLLVKPVLASIYSNPTKIAALIRSRQSRGHQISRLQSTT